MGSYRMVLFSSLMLSTVLVLAGCSSTAKPDNAPTAEAGSAPATAKTPATAAVPGDWTN